MSRPAPFLPWRLVPLFAWLAIGFSLAGCGLTGPAGGQTTTRPPADLAAAVGEAPPLDEAALIRALHERVNEARRRNALPPYVHRDDLARLARAHSYDMLRRGFFAHVNPDGEGPTERGARQDLVCRKVTGPTITSGIGENLYSIYRFSGYTVQEYASGGRRYRFAWRSLDEIAREVVDGWMESPAHRKNLLARVVDAHGIGVAVSGEGEIFVTQNLC
jgi:uncharacterized protein YkwD